MIRSGRSAMTASRDRVVRLCLFAAVAGVGAVGAACGGDDAARPIAELQDPATCMECHPKHFQQWSGSMHAYASEDPVFVAMNKRGQRETAGALGTFCVQCHAPMAVKLGLTNGTDFDPAQLPPTAKGITCYFCHNVKSVADTHNNGLVLADDQTMRGGLARPVSSPAHHSAYDKLMEDKKKLPEMLEQLADTLAQKGVKYVDGDIIDGMARALGTAGRTLICSLRGFSSTPSRSSGQCSMWSTSFCCTRLASFDKVM
jgi:hypothetical protein